jgi:hypothetical protein
MIWAAIVDGYATIACSIYVVGLNQGLHVTTIHPIWVTGLF